MKILISGYSGHMGHVLKELVTNDDELELVAGVGKSIENNTCDGNVKLFNDFNSINIAVDAIIDFSNHIITKDLISYAVKNNIRLVIATTGHTDEEKNLISEASKKIPIFFAANYSVGVAVLIEEAKRVASVFKNADIEIVETHHNRKIDAPSGTALKIAEGLKEIKPNANIVCGRSGQKKREKNDIGVNSVRLGNVVGIHEVMISTEHECITLKHEAYDRGLFAEGAINAAKFLKNKTTGLYVMNDLLKR